MKMSENLKKELPNEIKNYDYFFIGLISIEFIFIVWRFLFTSTRNGTTFFVSFFIIAAISFPAGLGVSLNIFKNKSVSFLLAFGLCLGFGVISSVWAILIQIGCPLNPYIYVLFSLAIGGGLLYVKRAELKICFSLKEIQKDLPSLLSPLSVLLFSFIVLSTTWINSYVPTDVDCQSDSFTTLMICKDGSYPTVSPFLDQTRLQLGSGPVYHTLVSVITKLKGNDLLSEVMAISTISAAFFCMAIYFFAGFFFKNQVILFLAGALTLTRAYLSWFNDGNLSENIAFYYAAMFLVFLMHTMESKRIKFSVATGLCLSLCSLSHPEVFLYTFPAFCLFFVTLLIASNKDLKKDYLNLTIVLAIILSIVLVYMMRLKKDVPMTTVFVRDATTLLKSWPFWNGYVVLILGIIGIVILSLKRKTSNIYIWTYCLMAMFIIEHWRLYPVLSPSWYELKSIAGSRFGSVQEYTTIFRHPRNYHSSWIAAVIILPIAISGFVDFINNNCIRYINIKLIKKNMVFFLAALIFLLIFNEYKRANRYPEFILKSDYAVLKWIKNNTNYNDTLIYSPLDNKEKDAFPGYLTVNWVPIVSERKSMLFRNYNISSQFKFLNMDSGISDKISQLQDAIYSINSSGSYKVLKEMDITHIFISALLTGNLYNDFSQSPYVELLHHVTVQEQGTALVYKVK